MSDAHTAGLFAIGLVLVSGAVFGHLHRENSEGDVPTGDRVASGLLALPVIGILAHVLFPDVHVLWKLLSPTPVAIYALLLAGTDWKWPIAVEHFTMTLVIAIGLVYLAVAFVVYF